MPGKPRKQRASFCIQLGASFTFSRFSSGSRAIVRRIRHTTSAPRSAPHALHTYRPGHIKRRPPSIKSFRSVKRVRSFTKKSVDKSVRMAKRAAATLRHRSRVGSKSGVGAPTGDAPAQGQAVKQRSCWGRCWCSLLLHVNLFMMAYVGAALSMAARLHWDPSTYVVVREVIPTEYELAQLGLLAGAAALTALVQLAALALHSRYRCRKTLLLIYAVIMLIMLTAEVVVAQQVLAEAEAQIAAGRAQLQALLDALKYTIDAIPQLELPGLEIIDQIPDFIGKLPEVTLPQIPDVIGGLPQLQDVTLPQIPDVIGGLPQLPDVVGGLPEIPDLSGQLPSFPGIGRHSNATALKSRKKRNILLNMNIINKLKSIIEDVKKDAPMNIKVAMIAMYVLAVLQACAVVLALFAAIAEPSRRPPAVVAAPQRCLSECPVYDV